MKSRSMQTAAHGALAARLRSLREQAFLSQSELASRMGRHQVFVSNIETGVRRLDVVEFHAYVTALNVDPSALFNQISIDLTGDYPL